MWTIWLAKSTSVASILGCTYSFDCPRRAIGEIHPAQITNDDFDHTAPLAAVPQAPMGAHQAGRLTWLVDLVVDRQNRTVPELG